jgi:hypothetical protein
VIQRIFCRFLNDGFLLISVSPSNDFPISKILVQSLP